MSVPNFCHALAGTVCRFCGSFWLLLWCFRQVDHFATNLSMSADIPGLLITDIALDLHFSIPRWLSWISGLGFSGIINFWAKKTQSIGLMDLFFELDFHFVFLNVSVNFPKFGRLVVFNPFHCNILYFPLPIQFMLCRLGYLNLPTTWRLGGGGVVFDYTPL